MEGRLTVESNALNNRANEKLVFKNNAPFRSCKSKINNTFTFIDNGDLDIFKPMCHFIEYGDNYSTTIGGLRNSYIDQENDATNADAANYRVSNKKTTTSRYFEYKTKVTGKKLPIAGS